MMYKACSRCGKIHDVNYQCKREWARKSGAEKRLRSLNAWTLKSQEIREKANYLCEVCKAEGVLSYERIEVHHIVKIKDDMTKLLDNFNLICLCQIHHKQAESGAIKVERLKELARLREKE